MWCDLQCLSGPSNSEYNAQLYKDEFGHGILERLHSGCMLQVCVDLDFCWHRLNNKKLRGLDSRLLPKMPNKRCLAGSTLIYSHDHGLLIILLDM